MWAGCATAPPEASGPIPLLTTKAPMQDLTQTAIQPFVKLAQSNVELVQQFMSSPEVSSQSMSSVQNLMQQAQESTMKLAQSNAFATLMQGMLKNYTEFMMSLGQSSMQAMAQGQQTLVQQGQEAVGNVIEATEAKVRRAR